MSVSTRQSAGAAPRGGDAGREAEDAARAVTVRRSAWVLGGLAVFFYLAFIVWMLVRAPLGG